VLRKPRAAGRRRLPRLARLTIDAPACPAATGADATAHLTVHDGAGALVEDVGVDVGADVGNVAKKHGTAFDLPPGTYRLRVDLADQGTFEQSVTVVAGWRTCVDVSTRPELQPERPDLTASTIFMVASDDDQGRPESSQRRKYAELVKAWVAGPQATIASAHAERLTTSPIDDPLFALCVAHTLVKQAQNDRGLGRREPKSRRALLKTLATRLDTLIPDHPDLGALWTWLGMRTSRKFPLPPMLSNSWVVVSAAAARRAATVPAGSLSSLIAAHIRFSPVWLVWRADQLPAVSLPAGRAKR
jgi:hypothetical protein